MAQDTKLNVSSFQSLLQKYSSSNFNKEWDELISSLLFTVQHLFQLRAVMGIEDRCTIKLVLPHKMYGRFLQDLRKLGTRIEEQEGHFILHSKSGDTMHVFSADKADEIFALHLQ